MNTISVSFIIPYFNIEKSLLLRCLNSIIALENVITWEIILIDDASKSPFAKQCIKKIANPRIRYIRQEKNKGLSEARNLGMLLAKHNYILFVDADDYLFIESTRNVLQLLAEKQPDILMFKHKKVYDSIAVQSYDASGSRIRFSGNPIEFMNHHNIRGSACGYFFKRELAQTIHFTPGILHEDEEFTPLLLLEAKELIITDAIVYAYYQRHNSIIQNKDKEHTIRKMNDMVNVMTRLQEHVQHFSNAAAKKALQRRIDMLAVSVIYLLITDTPYRSIIRQILQSMHQKGFYPLHLHLYSFIYVAFYVLTPTVNLVSLYHSIYRILHR